MTRIGRLPRLPARLSDRLRLLQWALPAIITLLAALYQRGVVGLQAFYEHHPDLVILDMMMPKAHGWVVCERLREVSDAPVIMLTAKGEERDRLRGFRLGVDDYVVKPFSFAELVARVGAILARSRRPASEPHLPPIVRGDVVIDLAARRARLPLTRPYAP